MIPKTQMLINKVRSFGFTALLSITTLGKLKVVTPIKKLKVTPKGRPAVVKPIKIGIEEQLQNGVIVPRRAPIILAPSPLNFPMIFLLRSGGKKL